VANENARFFEIVFFNGNGITGWQRILFNRQSIRTIINHNASQDLLASRLDNHRLMLSATGSHGFMIWVSNLAAFGSGW